jgi:MYXO-CTERM domain-containing protein
MIDRGAGNDAQWLGADLDLLTDFLGIDTRTGNGGNGDWLRDGASEPTYLTLSLSGLPAGDYNWKSFHHDTENVWADFQVEISADGGGTYSAVGDFEMSSSSTGGNPPNPSLVTDGVVSTVETMFSANGSDDVSLRFAAFADGVDPSAVHKQIFAINGFQVSVVPEPGSAPLAITAAVGLLAISRRRRK